MYITIFTLLKYAVINLNILLKLKCIQQYITIASVVIYFTIELTITEVLVNYT